MKLRDPEALKTRQVTNNVLSQLKTRLILICTEFVEDRTDCNNVPSQLKR